MNSSQYGQGMGRMGEHVRSSPQFSGFQADDCLLGLLRQGRDSGPSITIAVDGIGCISVDFRQGAYRSDVHAEADFFTTDPGHVRVEQPMQVIDGPGRPLEELMWKAAYFGSAGRLLEGCNLYDVVELQRWPNFTRLPHATSCLPLCSLLARRPSSIAFAHRMLRVPPADAVRFYSAARSAGYLQVISSQPDAGEGEPSGAASNEVGSNADSSSFWGRLFSRFSGL